MIFDEFAILLSFDIFHIDFPYNYKSKKIYKFNGNGDPMKHIQGLHKKYEFKVGVDQGVSTKFFPNSLEGDACDWLYSLLEDFMILFYKLYI